MKTPKILKSEDYGQFSFIEWNRGLNKSNINKLVEENEKEFKMHLFPIIVDNDYNILDGQHRFKACEENDWPIFYIVKGEVSEYYEEIRSVNRAGKNHTLLDKFEMILKRGNPTAVRINECYLGFNEAFALNTVVKALGAGGTTGGGMNRNLDKGLIGLDRDFASIFNGMKKLKETGHKPYTSQLFVMACKDVSKKYTIDMAEMVDKIIVLGVVVKQGMSREFVREKIKEAWNHGRRKDRIQ